MKMHLAIALLLTGLNLVSITVLVSRGSNPGTCSCLDDNPPPPPPPDDDDDP